MIRQHGDAKAFTACETRWDEESGRVQARWYDDGGGKSRPRLELDLAEDGFVWWYEWWADEDGQSSQGGSYESNSEAMPGELVQAVRRWSNGVQEGSAQAA